jgi:cell division protein FtsW (lipid II flippase)/cell division protein FtsI/penicillin-binding protein 2
MMAIGLSYSGRVRSNNESESRRSQTNLNTVADSHALEPALGAIFANAVDRRFAAAHLFEYIDSVRSRGDSLPNVGAILGATVAADVIERAPLLEYKERLRQAFDRADSTSSPRPATLLLLNASHLAALKPAFVVRTPRTFGGLVLLWASVYLASVWVVALLWWVRRFRGDYLLLGAGHLLTAVGFAMIVSRPDPLRDTALFIRYSQGIALGFMAFAVVSLVDFRKAALLKFSYVPLVGALFLCGLLILFGSGPGGSNAKVNLGPVQPIEAIRLLLALFLAGYFARRWELLRQIRGQAIREVRIPGWLNLPRIEYVVPVAVGIAAALTFFFLQKDLGPALVVSCIFLAAYAMARNRAGMAIAGLAVLVAGFYVGYKLNVSTTLAGRVQMWQSAWDNGARGGDQIAQAIWAVSTGSVLGTGLGLGDTRYLPAGHTDLVLAAIGEELGFIGLLSVAGMFALIAIRGFGTALRAANDYGFFLATVVTLFLILPVLIMAAGMLGVIPLTGVVTPFLSYGGSAMVANFVALGMLTSIRMNAAAAPISSPFRTSVTSLASLLGIAAIALLGVLLNVQVVRADNYVVKPHLGLQADGVRRYQYNQRVLDAAGLIPRGTIYDRQGLPLATSGDDVARRAAVEYRKHGIDVDPSCTAPVAERCYPIGGAAFHLLGDAPGRRNWSATNTSYVERDAQDRLRGFDDHALTVMSTDASGRSVPAIRQDYRELLPLLRHRYEPDHAEVTAFLNRKRDIRLTVDASLQVRVARILSKYAQRSASRHAAAVVIDPDTGHVLASVSYPFPGAPGDQNGESSDASESLLDRARYGLYPPGSTFKLVTAAAALRLDSGAGGTTFLCTKVAGGRVGTRIPGWGLVRDDVLDAHPHGTINLHDAIVQSCNAYFAQLAVRLGPQRILDTAALVGVSVTRDGSVGRLRATLPQAGYGQGDVVSTPLRMARIAAAIAGRGILREPRLEVRPSDNAQTHTLLTPDAAAHLGQYLRDAVLTGTGRSLRAHPWRIAGKTGTAEVGGSPSHAWFVGFAPHGRAEKRVAFAIIIENAGYGGLAAAPAAGEIVSAAAASGLIR